VLETDCSPSRLSVVYPLAVLAGLEVEVKLRPTVSWTVRCGVRQEFGTSGQFFFLLEIFFRQLRVIL
jgi:hypothetical protein